LLSSRNGIGGLVFLPSRRQRSGVAGDAEVEANYTTAEGYRLSAPARIAVCRCTAQILVGADGIEPPTAGV
jgi:hypothetical protein